MFNKFLMLATAIAFFVPNVKSQNQPVKCASNETSYNLHCTKQEIALADREKITIRVYTKEKAGETIDRTFVVVHNNEQKGLDAAKKIISENYGRLVEVVSNYKNGFQLNAKDLKGKNEKRYLYFGNGSYCIDPNRIYSKIGIKKNLSVCETIPNDKIDAIYAFGQKLIKIVTQDGTYKFIIGVHNNGDTPLSLNSWSEGGDEVKTAFGIFKANNHVDGKVFNTNSGNFVLATNGALLGQLLDNGLYFVALQENREYLTKFDEQSQKTIVKEVFDDGSMSIYFGATLFKDSGKPFDYINIEAEGKENPADDNETNKKWQKKVIALTITKIKP